MKKFLVVVCSLFLGSVAYGAAGGPDEYGYTFKDQAEVDGPVFTWVDISASGQAVVLNGDDVASTWPGPFGIASPVTLGRPFTIYGTTYTQLVPAANGYISGDIAAMGTDNSSDCPLPQTPSADPGGLRLYPFHTDLVLSSATARVYYEYLDVSPHPHSCLGVSVFSWEEIYQSPTATNISFQVLLFDNGDVLFQYGTDCSAKFATVGIQDDTIALASNALVYACNTVPSLLIASNTAVLFEPPIIEVTTGDDELDVPAGAEVSLREAIRDIPVGGKIHLMVDDDVMELEATNGTLNIMKPLSIDGQFNPGEVKPVLSGKNFGSNMVDVLEANVAIRAMVFERGNSTDTTEILAGGNAIIFRAGGPDYNQHLNLCEVDFLDHRYESALHVLQAEKAVLNRCRFHGNKKSDGSSGGGAIRAFSSVNTNAALCIYNSEFGFNKVESSFLGGGGLDGGALYINRVDTVIKDTAFFNNSAEGQGGAIYAQIGTIEMENCTLSHNRSGDSGGAAYITTFGTAGISTNLILHCTFVDNDCAGDGSGIAYPIFVGGSVLRLSRNIFKQTALDVPPLVSLGYNLSDRDEGARLNSPQDIENTDPVLSPLGAYGGFSLSHLPLRGSPAIDAIPSGVAGVDQRGILRPQNGDGVSLATRDIGSVEAGEPIEVTTSQDQTNGVGVGGTSLRETIEAAVPGQHIVFTSGFSGFTVTPTITNFVLGTEKHVHIDASDLTEPVILNADSIGFASLFDVTGVLSMHHVRMIDGATAVFLDDQGSFTGDRCEFDGFTAGPSFLGFPQSVIANEQDALNFHGTGPCVLDHCELSDNIARGVGLNNDSYNNRIIATWIHDNVAGSGGGVHSKSRTYMEDTVISDNQATGFSGGGAWFLRNHVLMQGVTFSGNEAKVRGGAIMFENDVSGEMSHCTVVGNRAGEQAGGFHRDNSDCPFFLHHTIFNKNDVIQEGFDENIYSPFSNDVARFYSLGYNLFDDSNLFSASNDITNTDAQLTPLIRNGNVELPSHYPLEESPAIDAGADFVTLGICEDVLELPRIADGNLDGTNRIDIGAVEAAAPVMVTTTADEFDVPSGANVSLREAMRDSGPDGRILFDDSVLSTNMISLTMGELAPTNSLLIDASGFRDGGGDLQGITLNGMGTTNRVLSIDDEDELNASIHGVSFTGGMPLTLGGAVLVSDGQLYLTQGTIYNNQTQLGGGIYGVGDALIYLQNATLYGNVGTALGGAIFASGSGVEVELHHCTVTENGGAGGVLYMNSSSILRLYSTIVAGNNETNFTVTGGSGGIFSLGYNLTDYEVLSHSNDLVQTPALLFPALDRWGGLCDAVIPDAGSIAVDRGPLLFRGPPCRDARGFNRIYGPRVDIGAAEIGAKKANGDPGTDGDGNGMDETWENYYGAFLPGDNPDGDTPNNLAEYEDETHPGIANVELEITAIVGHTNDMLTLTWANEPHAAYWIQTQDDSISSPLWDTDDAFPGSATNRTSVILPIPSDDANFYRIKKY